jgi:hypothetical protein
MLHITEAGKARVATPEFRDELSQYGRRAFREGLTPEQVIQCLFAITAMRLCCEVGELVSDADVNEFLTVKENFGAVQDVLVIFIHELLAGFGTAN